jgi:hypothetical protein
LQRLALLQRLVLLQRAGLVAGACLVESNPYTLAFAAAMAKAVIV